MRIRWREFELPNRVSIEKGTYTDFMECSLPSLLSEGLELLLGMV